MPFVILGAIAIIGGLATLALPETMGKQLPDSIAQAETLEAARGEPDKANGTVTGKDNNVYISDKNVDVTVF